MKNKKVIYGLILLMAVLIIIFIGWKVMDQTNRYYSIETINKYDYFVLYKDGFMGVIDNKGNTIIEPVYDMIRIPNPTKSVFLCYFDYDEETEEYERKVLNEKQEEIFTEFEMVSAIPIKDVVSELPYEKSVLTFIQDGKYGLIDFNGKIIVKPIYDHIENASYKEGELLVKKEDKYGIVNIKGKTIIKPQYDVILSDNYYSETQRYDLVGYIVGNKTEEGYKYGYVNYKGQILLKVEHNKVTRLTQIQENENIYIIAEKNGQAGLIKNKEILLKNEYQSIDYDDLNKLFIIEKNQRYGVIDMKSNIVIPTEYDEIIIDGICIYALKEQEEKVFNVKGKEIKLQFKSLLSTTNENYYITIDEENYQGVANKQNQVLIPNEYLYVEYLFDDYFIVCDMAGRVGVKNIQNEIVLDLEYDVIQKIQNSSFIQAIHSNNEKTTIYSKQLEELYKGSNVNIEIYDDYIKIINDTDMLYLTLEGTKLLNTEVLNETSLYAKKEKGKWGFIDKSGNTKVDYIYDMVTEYNQYGFAGIKKDGKWGILDFSGKVIIEPKYSIDEDYGPPNFIGEYYKTHRGMNETYYTNQING